MVKGKSGPKPAPKAKTDKKPKAEPKVKAAAVSPLAPGMDPKKRELFLHDKGEYVKLKDKADKARKAANTASQTLRSFGKQVKEDGFTVDQIKLSIALDSPEGEAELRARISDDLIAAQYSGAPIGMQLALFLEPDRTPGVDIAYDEGMKASMEGRTADPGSEPSTAFYQSYMRGFNDETERRIQQGIKKKEPETEQKGRAAAMGKAREPVPESEQFH